MSDTNANVWNPKQYDRFRDERSRPFYDLLALVQRAAEMRVVDLGCGTGALTKHLHVDLSAKETHGIDSSASMLAKAKEQAAPGLSFAAGDLETWNEPGAWDLVLSNAALHWAGDHASLLARLAGSLTARGQLAVQVPANHDHVSHAMAAEVARESPFREATLGFERVSPVLAPEAYAKILEGLGFREQHVRLQVYGHHLGSRDDVVEWMKGTTLTDYQRRMAPEMFTSFVARYRARLLPELEDTRPYFFPFKRILFWGAR